MDDIWAATGEAERREPAMHARIILKFHINVTNWSVIVAFPHSPIHRNNTLNTSEAIPERRHAAHEVVLAMSTFTNYGGGLVTAATLLLASGCTERSAGQVKADGSSTVFPITAAVAESCRTNGIEYIELPVAYDGLAVVVNPKNTWAESITTAELKKIWQPEAQGQVTRWSQVRESWPDSELRLYGPGVDSGSYDYFTQAIVGKEHSSRTDFSASEDDTVLVERIAHDELALGYFGYAYYEENKARLKVLPVDDGDRDNGVGPVAPSAGTVSDGTYQPLSRPLFIYVAARSLGRGETLAFANFYLDRASELVSRVGYFPLPAAAYALARQRMTERKTGSIFGGSGSQVGVSIEELLQSEQANAN